MMLLVTFLGLLLAILGFMTAWFALAKLADRTDVVDIAWGLGFVYVALLTWLTQGTPTGLPLLTVALVTIWGLRLVLHIGSRNLKRHEDDHRYQVFRRKWAGQFWQTAYVRIFLLQGVLLLAISSTAVASILPGREFFQPLTVLGYLVWAFGIGFEAVADWQLRQFVRTKKPGQIMQRGLWRYSRHPNYFGEVTAWWGAAIVAVGVGQWWGVIGALVITVLITKVSGIPPLEQHYAANPAFQKYKQRTSVLVPLPPRS